MNQRDPLVLDLRPDGTFADPPAAPGLAIRLGRIATVVAVVSGLLGAALLALWFALALIPVAFVAGLIAFAAFRFQVWRAGGRAGPPGIFR